MRTTFLGLILIILMLTSCQQETPLEWSETPYLNVHSPWVDSNLQVLSTEEKIGQLIYLELEATSLSMEQLSKWQTEHYFGGLQLKGLSVNDYLIVQENIENQLDLNLLQGTDEEVLLNNQFEEAGDAPQGTVLSYLSVDDSLRALSRELFTQQLHSLGINTQFTPLHLLTDTDSDLFSTHHLQFVKDLPSDRILRRVDTVYWERPVQQQLVQLQKRGVSGFSLATDFMSQGNLTSIQLADLFRKELGFKGLLVAEATSEDALALLAGTVDLLRVKDNPVSVYQELLDAHREGILTDRELNIRVAKVLRAKEWLRQQKLELTAQEVQEQTKEDITYDQASVLTPVLASGKLKSDTSASPFVTIEEHFDENRWRLFNRKFYEKTSVLLHNRGQILPFKDLYRHHFRLVHIGNESRKDMESVFAHYADFSKYYHLQRKEGEYPPLRISAAKREICVVTVTETLEVKADSALIADLKTLAKDREVVLVHFGDAAGLEVLDTTFSVLHFPVMNATTQELSAQILFGGVNPTGKLPKNVNAYFRAGQGSSLKISRLSYQIPESLGISPEKLVGIDAIAKTAIADGAFPGCQVMVVKSGSVIYSKAFGHHDYTRKRKVRTTDLYDIASITKVAATTLSAMKLYEQGKFKINDKVKNYLDCPSSSNIKNVTIKKLLIHQSGIQPHMPVVPYLLYRDTFNVGCDSFFCNEPSEEYPYQIAENMFFSERYYDEIWANMHDIRVGSQRRFRYSDANFYLIQQILEKQSATTLDKLARHYFYTPLGLRYTTFRPYEHFSLKNIVPTQQDDRWRQQLVHGYVHDETAALLNGVGGHAGLFANAEDLAVIFQMLLNKGYYGDRQYLKPETIELFTSATHGNHRGFGFDTAHPDSHSAFSHSASERTFGHTGFTGTCVWADPDNELLFVFLSNRINPDIKNKKLFRNRIRERMHQVAYDAIGTHQPQELKKQIVVK